MLHPERAAQVASLIRGMLPRFVRGIQLDADVPTARLPEYAQFLTALRRELPNGTRLGVTALPDWLRSTAYDTLCRSVDEIAPQFYGNRWPESGKAPPPLWETAGLLEAVRRASVGPARVWVGLPAYGRCLVISPEGKPVGVRHDLSPDPLLDDLAWTQTATTRKSRFGPEGSQESEVEDQLTLHTRADTDVGPLEVSEGTTLWFQWPRVSGLRSAVAAIREARFPNVDGVALFRWPAPEESLAVPVRLEGSAPAPHLVFQLEKQGRLHRVIVVNEGDSAPSLREPVRLEVEVADGVLVDLRPGDSADDRDNCVRRERPYLPPGSRWVACELRDGRGPIHVRLSWQDADGRPREMQADLPARGEAKR